ncbi:MAG: precorrin-4/cobalt-precorrin-4 C11-methyltransferase [bacterium]|jgi:precorrin-4 methylase
MSAGRVLFVGCGPGAPDLLTLRAVRALQDADVVIWNPSLLDRDALDAHVRPDAQVVAWPPAGERDILAVYERALADGLLVVRLKGGDPTLLGRIQPELAAVQRLGLGCEIVPGVSAHGAGAAALAVEIATAQAPLVIADAGALPDRGAAATCIAVYGAGRDPHALQRDLRAGGWPDLTPCVVAIELSRRGQTLVACALGDLAETLEDHARGLMTIALVGVPCGAGPPGEKP